MIELKIAMQGNAHRLRFLVYEDATLLPTSLLHILRNSSTLCWNRPMHTRTVEV